MQETKKMCESHHTLFHVREGLGPRLGDTCTGIYMYMWGQPVDSGGLVDIQQVA